MSSRLYRHLLTSFDVCHNCLHCCLRCDFSDVFIVTLSPASSCHYQGFRVTLPPFTGFAQQLVRMLSIFYFDSCFLNTVVNTVSVVCTSSLPPSPPSCTYFTSLSSLFSSLHYRVYHCCHILIVCIMRCYVSFYLHSNQSTSCAFVFALCCRMSPICRLNTTLVVTFVPCYISQFFLVMLSIQHN